MSSVKHDRRMALGVRTNILAIQTNELYQNQVGLRNGSFTDFK